MQPPSRTAQTTACDKTVDMLSVDDTICAVSTPAGAGRRAIVRLSGPDSVRVMGSVFTPTCAGDLSEAETFVVVPGRVSVAGFPSGLRAWVYVMRAPRSFTRQDVVELHLPGCAGLVEAVLERLTASGARLARAGEFTERAYLSGRIDLAQAEAVLKVVSAASQQEARIALTELEGELSRDLEGLRERLVDLLVQLEADLDFSEQGIELIEPAAVAEGLAEVGAELAELASMSERSYVFRERPRVMLAGAPNVGKSSLFNRLLGSAEAIISEVPGTTRDVLEATLRLGGWEVTLVDAAGTGDGEGELAASADVRARREMEKADLILFVMDSRDDSGSVREFLPAGRQALLVMNKVDMQGHVPGDMIPDGTLGVCRVSAKTGEGLSELVGCLEGLVSGGMLERSAKGYMLNLRQREGLARARGAIERATATIDEQLGFEFTALEVREAANALAELTSPIEAEGVLERIFSQFCVGK